MKITRIFCLDDGASAFEDIEIELTHSGTIGSLSKPYPVSSVVFRETPPEYDFDWHPAPHRQYIILLDGEIEIESRGGDKRRFRGGDILLVEDTWGSGHRTRTTNGKLRHSIFIRLDV
jgi:uncharacterized cupin superfamily protein